jgi:NAD(P)H-dependent flavin oxidoreductase YrpB (nitropropane dioxygenase family)
MTPAPSGPLSSLGIDLPLIAAPMAGGPSTVDMVLSAAEAGAFGFLAAGYKAPEAIGSELAQLRAASTRDSYGVNLFVPTPVPIDERAYRSYAAVMQAEADRFGIDLPTSPNEDDDNFGAKVEMLLAEPVPVVSFTFGIPDAAVIAALRSVGSTLIQTVTSSSEAAQSQEAGVDILAVQSGFAGGHSGTWTPDHPPVPIPAADLVAEIKQRVELPLVAAGGIATPEDVVRALAAGADAAMVGTALLRSDESGASAIHRAALTDPARTETVVTRAFTGRPARGLRNAFIDRYESIAPLGYPAVHYLTSPLRKAAAAAGQADLVHLWAGTGYRHATEASTARILTELASRA